MSDMARTNRPGEANPDLDKCYERWREWVRMNVADFRFHINSTKRVKAVQSAEVAAISSAHFVR